jgi:thiaminase
MTTKNPNNSGNDKGDHDVSHYFNILDRLRQESFNATTNAKLAAHPYLIAAKEGKLSLKQRQAFVGEQYAIQYSDACSFARLAGHDDFQPAALSVATVPPPVEPDQGNENKYKIPDIFQFILGGEIFASKMLLDHAKTVEMSEESLRQYPNTAKAQAYPSFWAKLALSRQRGAGAAACAVNFPAWGKMCKELSEALKTRPEYGYVEDDNVAVSLAFVDFFATPIENLDEMAVAVMQQERTTYEDVATAVRMLQEYEVMFWDSIYEGK